MKKENKKKNSAKGKWTQMFATDFSFEFSGTGDLFTKRERKEEQ